MHEIVGAEIVEASAAVEFDKPVWMESDGKICDGKNSVGFMVTHSTNNPDYFIVASVRRAMDTLEALDFFVKKGQCLKS